MANSHTHLRTIANQDGAAILDINAGRITTLNTSGGFIWQALEAGLEPECIAQDLSRDAGEPIETVRRDVADFIAALKKQDLLPD